MLLIKLILTFLILICGFTTIAFTQPSSSKAFKTLNVADGLPQSFISGLVQDSTGFVWIGTRDGLARYDGKGFKIFRHIPGDTATLADNIISNLYLDKEGRLWIFFEVGDIDVLNTSTEALFHFTKDAVYKPTFASLHQGKAIAEDRRGNIWLLHLNGGIFVCNPAKKTLCFYSDSALGLHDKITAIAANNDDIVLLTHHSLVRINEDMKLLKTVPYIYSDLPHVKNHPLSARIAFYIFRSNGDMIILNESAVIIYHSATQMFSTILLPGDKGQLNLSMVQDDKGQIFFNYKNTLYVLSPQNNITVWKPKKENPPNGCKSMLIDRSGILWLGGNGSGIQLHDLRLPRLQGLQYQKNFHVDVLKNFLNVPQNELTKTNLYDILSYFFRWTKGTRNDIWLSRGGAQTHEHLEVYHYANGHLTLPPWHYLDTATAAHTQINSLAFSPSGGLWGIDFFMRPVYFDTLTYAVTVYPPLTSVNADYSFSASSLLIDNEEKFWISSAIDGLFCFDKKSGQIIHFIADETPGSLSANQLMNIIQDPADEHILWIGSLGGGLIKFNKGTGKSIAFTTREGLPNNTVYAIILDKNGMLWCSSNKGIFSFDRKSGTIRSFISKDGLPGDEFNRYHFMQLPDGRIAFGGVDGYTVFDPLHVADDTFSPPVALTGISINNIPADYGLRASPFKAAINSLNQIVLPYTQNFLAFEFAALEYNITEKLQYRYKLKGLDENWVNAGNDNIATYTRLPPGHYTLMINATNTAGKWSSYIKTLSVIIEPPFWKTWWFIALCVLAVAGIIYLVTKNRIKKVRKEEQQKAAFEREASELKAEALRAQMNPHFIFNCLNSIKALIQEDNKQQAVTYLTTFSKLIRNQLNNAQREISLYEELETCRLYTSLEALRFSSKIVCEFDVDEKVDTHSMKVPPLILQPFIENAIWHGIVPKESGKVKISVTGKNDFIQCAIEDDGIGRETSMRSKSQTSATYQSKGMKLVQGRLNLHNIINNLGGTIELIDKKDKDGSPAGTLIIVTFKKEV